MRSTHLSGSKTCVRKTNDLKNEIYDRQIPVLLENSKLMKPSLCFFKIYISPNES